MRAHVASRLALVPLVIGLVGCPTGARGPGGGGGGASVEPDACGQISLTRAGRTIYAFLKATAELEREVYSLEANALATCKSMGQELGMAGSALSGDTATVCKSVSDALRSALQVSVKAEANFEVVYTPAVCTVDAQLQAQAKAECEAQVTASAEVTCEGSCSGTCTGACDGTCSAKNASGQCEGQCDGTCRGTCSAQCTANADVDAQATCEASAEVHAAAEVRCTEPQMDIKYDAGMVVDAAKLDAATRAIKKGLGGMIILKAQIEGPLAGAITTWTRATKALYGVAGDAVGGLGKASTCVLGQIGAAFAAIGSIQVSVSVSVQASASVGGACNAHP